MTLTVISPTASRLKPDKVWRSIRNLVEAITYGAKALSVIEGYLTAFSKALHQRFPRLIYIDAFAGTMADERCACRSLAKGDLFEAAIE